MAKTDTNFGALTEWLFAAFFFLLPWGTRWIYGASSALPSEWGRLSFYLSEIVLWLALLVFMFVVVRDWRRYGFKYAVRWDAKRLALLALALFFIFVFVRSFFVADINVAMQWGGRAISAGLLFLVLFFRGECELTIWGWALVLGFLLPGIFALIQFFIQYSPASSFFGVALHESAVSGASVIEAWGGRWLRSYGFFSHPNILGAYSIIVWLICAHLLGAEFRKLARIVLISISLLASAVLFFSFSRSAWLVFILCLVVLFSKKIYRQYRPLILSSAVLLIIFSFIFSPLVLTRVLGYGRLEGMSFSERVLSLNYGVVIFKDNLLFGAGPMHSLIGGWQEPIHNVFLLIAAEFGILGSALVISFLIFWWFGLLKVERWGFGFGLVLLGIFFLFDHFWYTLPQGMLMAAIFGSYPHFIHNLSTKSS